MKWEVICVCTENNSLERTFVETMEVLESDGEEREIAPEMTTELLMYARKGLEKPQNHRINQVVGNRLRRATQGYKRSKSRVAGEKCLVA